MPHPAVEFGNRKQLEMRRVDVRTAIENSFPEGCTIASINLTSNASTNVSNVFYSAQHK